MAEKEYIERELAEKTIDRFEGYLDDDMIFRIKYAIRKHIPAADVVPVVRCKDCKHSHYWYGNDTFGNTSYLCDFYADRYCAKVHADDFCSYGKREENGNE